MSKSRAVTVLKLSGANDSARSHKLQNFIRPIMNRKLPAPGGFGAHLRVPVT